MFIFECQGFKGEKATIKVASLYWTDVGQVSFDCNDDGFALLLLTNCRSDSAGFFNLLAGSKPLWVEQWLEYLEETGELKKLTSKALEYQEEKYPELLQLNDETATQLLDLVYQVGGFNRLQITRYLKNRNNLTYMSTKYSQEDLTRYRQLGETINFIRKLKTQRES